MHEMLFVPVLVEICRLACQHFIQVEQKQQVLDTTVLLMTISFVKQQSRTCTGPCSRSLKSFEQAYGECP